MIAFKKTDAAYGCFSNFTPCHIEFEGVSYQNSEAAWQSLKSLDMDTRKSFSELSAGQAKKKGRRVALRSDWESVKYQLMVDVCYAKFTQNEEFKQVLLSTGDDTIVEDTTGWHDNIWGNCNCPKCQNKVGRNLLGKALMEVRARIVEG